MDPILFIVYSLISFVILIAGAIFWYIKSINFNHEDLCDKGVTAFQKRDYEKAKEMFTLSLEDVPDYRESKFKLGMTFVELEQYENAIKCFKEVIESDNEDFEARYNLGLVYFKLGDYEQARKSFQDILALDPWDLSALFNLALTYQMQKSYEKAKELYEKFLEKSPQDPDCYFNLGLMEFERGEYQTALDLFEKAHSYCFGRTDIMFSIIRCKDELCKYETQEEGIDIVNQYTKISKYFDLPLDFDIYWARAFAKTGNLNKSLEICNRALVSSPNNAVAYRLLGLLKLLKKDLDMAKQLLLKAIDMDIYNPEGYNLLSYVFLQENNVVEHVQYKTKYRELIAENPINAG